MLNKLFKTINSYSSTKSEADLIRKQLQTIFLKVKTYQNYFKNDPKLNFNLNDKLINEDGKLSGAINYFLGDYAIRYELDDIKSIQLYRRGKTDSLQYAELLAISFIDTIEYISDPLFVKLDIKQLELSISHVVNKKS